MFSTNVTPRKFGQGKDKPEDWTCKACNSFNKKHYAKCDMCGVEKKLSDQINAH